jgi:hypothetical protein
MSLPRYITEPSPPTATIASSTPTGACQPFHLTPGSNTWRAAGETLKPSSPHRRPMIVSQDGSQG